MQFNDDRLTFLLPRPVWVNDMDVAYCSSCNTSFGPLKRRHHCRSCGNIFCHDCSNKSVRLPQLGYGTRPVRVCNGCFDVAYLVTYAIDEDYGLFTQMHGVRGLLELIEKDDEKDLHNMVAYGGVDALIWLCRASRNTNLHHLVTTVLAMLSEKEAIRPVIITKWALPPLLFLIQHYTTLLNHNSNLLTDTASTNNTTLEKKQSSNDNYTQPYNTQQTSASSSSATTNPIHSHNDKSVILEIVINCTHILYQLARAGILSQKEVFTEGILAILFELAAFSLKQCQIPHPLPPITEEAKNSAADDDDDDDDKNQLQQQQQQLRDRVHIIQGLAAKSISCISSIVAFQTGIIEYIVHQQEQQQQEQHIHNRSIDKLATLLRSDHEEVQKYIAKTVAYLSLKNDKYKPVLLADERAKALIAIIVSLPMSLSEEQAKRWKKEDLSYYQVNHHEGAAPATLQQQQSAAASFLNPAAVSHACCALANFATNNESQEILMSQPHFLAYICNVVHVFPTQPEIHKHMARCLANLALYEVNNEVMLSTKEPSSSNEDEKNKRKKKNGKDGYNVIPTLLKIGKTSAKSDVQRHIVRAVDNLSSNLPMDENNAVPVYLYASLKDAYAFIDMILNESNESEELKDADMMKRARSIMARQQSIDQQDTANESQTEVPAVDEGPLLSPNTAAQFDTLREMVDTKEKQIDVTDNEEMVTEDHVEEKEGEQKPTDTTTTVMEAKLSATASSFSKSSSSSTSKGDRQPSEEEDGDGEVESKEDDVNDGKQQHQEVPSVSKAVSTHQKASNNKKRRSKRHK